jgi:hypothetical protein
MEELGSLWSYQEVGNLLFSILFKILSGCLSFSVSVLFFYEKFTSYVSVMLG